jgi:hypothetical protein
MKYLTFFILDFKGFMYLSFATTKRKVPKEKSPLWKIF